MVCLMSLWRQMSLTWAQCRVPGFLRVKESAKTESPREIILESGSMKRLFINIPGGSENITEGLLFYEGGHAQYS